MANMTVKTDNLIGNLRETLRNLRRLSDALYAIAGDLGGDTPYACATGIGMYGR